MDKPEQEGYVPAAAAGRASDLCLSCGLCCNGGLYARVELEPDDRMRLAAAGFEAPAVFTHPCRHFAAGPCAIYPVRPTICRTFRCRVLDAFIADEIDFDTARLRVTEAIALKERMDEDVAAGLTPQAIVKEWVTDEPGARTPDRARATLAALAYWTFIERFFLNPGDTRFNRAKV